MKDPIQTAFNIEKEQDRFLDFYSATFKISKSETIRNLITQLAEQHQDLWDYSRKLTQNVTKKSSGEQKNEVANK